MHKERVKSASWAGGSSFYCICLQVREYKNQGWKKTAHFSVLSLQERGMHSQMHLVFIPPSQSLVSKAFLVKFLCAKRVPGCWSSVGSCRCRQHSWGCLLEVTACGVAADSLGPAAGFFS